MNVLATLKMVSARGKGYSDRRIRMGHTDGASLVARWLRLCTPNAGGLGSIPGQGTRSHMHVTAKSLRATTKELGSRN